MPFIVSLPNQGLKPPFYKVHAHNMDPFWNVTRLKAPKSTLELFVRHHTHPAPGYAFNY